MKMLQVTDTEDRRRRTEWYDCHSRWGSCL